MTQNIKTFIVVKKVFYIKGILENVYGRITNRTITVIPDMLSTNLFLERLGYTVKGLSAYISEKEEKYLAWRNQTRECIPEEDNEQLSLIISTLIINIT